MYKKGKKNGLREEVSGSVKAIFNHKELKGKHKKHKGKNMNENELSKIVLGY